MSARPNLKLVEKTPAPTPRLEVRISTTMARGPYGRSRCFRLRHRELAELLAHAECLERRT
jgi:hypothetical protein